jgi:hypothetical protein
VIFHQHLQNISLMVGRLLVTITKYFLNVYGDLPAVTCSRGESPVFGNSR